MDPNRLRELIEARHPDAAGWDAAGCDAAGRGLDPADLRLLEEAMAANPALAAELARVEAWDVEVGQAMDDVPIPAGLADRLLAAVQKPTVPVPVAAEVTLAPAAVETVKASPTQAPPGASRRAWFGALAGLAAAILLAVGVTNWAFSPRQLAVEPLLEESRLACEQMADSGWSSNWKSELLADHDFDRGALVVTPLRWRQQATTVDPDAVIYDLAGPRRKAAHLLVYRVGNQQTGLAPFPTRAPVSTTGGDCVGAWQRGDLVYVLVVEGSAARYGTFIRELTTG